MYEEGFRWWNLGVASAVAFVLFLVIFAVSATLWRFDRDPTASR
jgi:multiple sugar transport system permease protein